ncbi:hypothetical protein DdX_16695 [Ditylenchus destructor]|uniref:Uncharacterized protein n=1 Tax=Ditylenchus destructor TaxID=166010 RepID=A0AAD4MNJ2_9BILA|nr:hypothetical protein DdX_16695 [Ditylenchus destructor]
MLITSYADVAPFAASDLCLVCPYFHVTASAVSSKTLRQLISYGEKEIVPTPLLSVPQRLSKPQCLPKIVSVSKSFFSTVPRHHGRRHLKGILTFEVDKILNTETTTDSLKAQETEKSADNIRSRVEATTTSTPEKLNRRPYDNNCFFTPMNCQLYLRV